MASRKKSISVYELAEKYLIKIGVSKTTAKVSLLPAKYNNTYLLHNLVKSNIVIPNKDGLGSHETHIAIPKRAWELFYTSSDVLSGLKLERNQPLIFFEANIKHMLDRRKSSKSTLLQPYTEKGKYSISDSLIGGNCRKWMNEHNSNTQVHIGKNTYDSDSFFDFRLGIQIDDYLILLKEKHTKNILAISIPSEFANKYSVTKSASSRVYKKRSFKDSYEDHRDDASYVESITDGSTAPQISPSIPQKAPDPKKSGSSKPKYTAKASIGKGAIEKAGFVCENCGKKTFTARSTGHDFMEPHHLIPISCQGNYEYDIDITSNIICLCPNCHSCFHYGTPKRIQTLLKKFLSLRKADLKTCGGIDIDENTLFSYYNI